MWIPGLWGFFVSESMWVIEKVFKVFYDWITKAFHTGAGEMHVFHKYVVLTNVLTYIVCETHCVTFCLAIVVGLLLWFPAMGMLLSGACWEVQVLKNVKGLTLRVLF